MRIAIFLIVLIFFQELAFSDNVIWQQSQDTNIQLGVRDKYGAIGKYQARFMIEGSGRAYSLNKIIKGDEWGFVYFPKDFHVLIISGDYSWKVVVNGNVVGKGNFHLVSSP
jgi:hypothetical protein